MKPIKPQHIISTDQFLDLGFLNKLFKKARDFEVQDDKNKLNKSLDGKILASVFYEPSTRTRFSFESAMHKLGGSVITTENAEMFSSATKGETLADSIRIIGGYADVIVLRHHTKGSAKLASLVSSVPVINAGDGPGEHPTQALLDIYTIVKDYKTVNNLSVALVGDLLYGRTVHSLLPLLSLYKGVHIYLISPKELALPKEFKAGLDKQKITYSEISKLDTVIDKVDVLYMTRIQKERFKDIASYNKVKNSFVLDNRLVKKMKNSATIMHPLPRVNEITPDVDNDPRAHYFIQAKNGLYIRMALLNMLIGK